MSTTIAKRPRRRGDEFATDRWYPRSRIPLPPEQPAKQGFLWDGAGTIIAPWPKPLPGDAARLDAVAREGA